MRYENICAGSFLRRLNRFAAEVCIQGESHRVHVKNTGRMGELLLPGAAVWLQHLPLPGRKTEYDLITVQAPSGKLFNIDSQAPNKVVLEWLNKQPWELIRPEYGYSSSRIDFYMEGYRKEIPRERYLMEVKGCTLEVDGIGYFPDAPTLRGVRHLQELAKAAREGYQAILAFVIAMDGVTEVRPNLQTHPEFGQALEEAKRAGVKVLMLPCHIETDSITISKSPEYAF